MKKYRTKLLSILLSGAILFTSSSNIKTSALSGDGMFLGTVGSVVASTVPSICTGIWNVVESIYDSITGFYKFKKYSGFRKPNEIIKNLEEIIQNKSKVCVYDQGKAKKQMMECLSSVVARVDNLKRGKDVKEIRGNIVYLI